MIGFADGLLSPVRHAEWDVDRGRYVSSAIQMP